MTADEIARQLEVGRIFRHHMGEYQVTFIGRFLHYDWIGKDGHLRGAGYTMLPEKFCIHMADLDAAPLPFEPADISARVRGVVEQGGGW